MSLQIPANKFLRVWNTFGTQLAQQSGQPKILKEILIVIAVSVTRLVIMIRVMIPVKTWIMVGLHRPSHTRLTWFLHVIYK